MHSLDPGIGPDDHVHGNLDAPVDLLEFGDFECPYCARAHVVVMNLVRRFGRDMSFAFRHFPLPQLHPHVVLAAEAAEAAGVQGKFWPMHDLLFENQDALELAHLLRYAGALRLDVTRFAEDLADRVHLPAIERDVLSGMKSGVEGTPTFFIAGVRHEGPWDRATLEAALLHAVRAKAA